MSQVIKFMVFVVFFTLGLNAQAAKTVAGQVRFFNNADTAFNGYVNNPNAVQKKWLRDHYSRMLTYPPSFDKKNAWYKGGLAYVDSYAIYANDSLAKAHPEWIMKDARGNKLYIPWSCGNGRCSQFAGDFSNPAFRRYMIKKMQATVKSGYKGLWLDDVNLTWRVGNSNDVNVHITPIDSNTGKAMTLNDWRHYFSRYLREVRAALPKTIEISHNAIWYADSMKAKNPYITQQIKAANYINLERGASDGGLVGGTGQWGYETFLKYIDYVHKNGAGVILMDEGYTPAQREYGLATWFLISQGNDFINSDQRNWITPDNWWKGYSLNLGKALNDRYTWNNLIRRDFACGSVFLNQPDTATRSVSVGNGYKNIDAQSVSWINLQAKTAAILKTACNAARSVPNHKFIR
ncbi:putative glycoside hydrolase [Crenothrix sp.]|uniref:putative glycoside hydrolase n=1 Tax=Crenothrix sp. TaxID=3100433 RepID=UPI00374D67BA